jgi:hypothetical protein
MLALAKVFKVGAVGRTQFQTGGGMIFAKG